MMQDNILTLSLRPDVTVVAVPYAVHYYRAVFEQGNPHVLWLMSKRRELRYTRRLKLPPGQYEIVGLLREIPEEQAAGLCDKYNEMGSFPSYKIPGIARWTHTGRQCITEAIKANGGDPEANWLLLKKIQ